ncbi:MAG: rhomboid family intramembrane serine protease [Verrucomicrobiales bacterium]
MGDRVDGSRHLVQTLSDGARRAGAHLWRNFRLIFVLVGVLWMIEVADQLLGRVHPVYTLDYLGVVPRTWWGLPGIFFAPLVHGSFSHLLNNTLPLLFLGWVVLLGGHRLFWQVTLICGLSAGAGTWVFGTGPGPHLGVSGVVYGYLGFLLVRGFLELSVRWVIVAVIIGILYSGALGGFLPSGTVSVAGHVFGFVGGILSGWLLFYVPRRRSEKRRGTVPSR